MKDYTWGTIVPLIGGLTVAGQQVLGKEPDFLISYKPFAENEQNVRANFPNVPFYLLDDDNYGGFDVNQKVDILSAVCPCAGLSMLSNGSPEHRATVNKWMIESAKFATQVLKPTVFWGENAPGLYSKMGEAVRNDLRRIANENGYSFSVYLTNTVYHGIPQYRKRTFYFFWKGDSIPYFKYYREPHKTLKEYLEEVPFGISGQTADDIKLQVERFNDVLGFKFLKAKYGNIDGFRNYPMSENRQQLTIIQYLMATGQIQEMRDWCLAEGMERSYKYAKRLAEKVESGKGFWDGSPLRFQSDGVFGAYISKTADALHPTEDRLITQREGMHLMGLPHDYKLVTGATNHICQNVPVCTGAAMYQEVVAALEGDRDWTRSPFMMQSNQSMSVDYKDTTLLEY